MKPSVISEDWKAVHDRSIDAWDIVEDTKDEYVLAHRGGFLTPGSSEVDEARARLAAQAPAMARLLLDGEWICEERGDMCRHCGSLQREGHASGCELVAVLRAAGVVE